MVSSKPNSPHYCAAIYAALHTAFISAFAATATYNCNFSAAQDHITCNYHFRGRQAEPQASDSKPTGVGQQRRQGQTA